MGDVLLMFELSFDFIGIFLLGGIFFYALKHELLKENIHKLRRRLLARWSGIGREDKIQYLHALKGKELQELNDSAEDYYSDKSESGKDCLSVMIDGVSEGFSLLSKSHIEFSSYTEHQLLKAYLDIINPYCKCRVEDCEDTDFYFEHIFNTRNDLANKYLDFIATENRH